MRVCNLYAPLKVLMDSSESENTEIVEQEESLLAPETSDLEGQQSVDAPNSGRSEMGVGTLMRLMGVASRNDLLVLESQLDTLVGKIASVGIKVERLSKHVREAHDQSYLERIDYQLADLRTLLKISLGQDSEPEEKITDEKKEAKEVVLKDSEAVVPEKEISSETESASGKDSEAANEQASPIK